MRAGPLAFALGLSAGLVALLRPSRVAADAPRTGSVAQVRALRALNTILSRRPLLDHLKVPRLAGVILRESVAAGIDPLFVVAIIETESGFDPEAVSPSGARGLMQVLPSTWADLVAVSRRLRPFDPCDNVTVGISYLGRLGRSFTRPESLLLAYNQGPRGASDIIMGRAQPTAEAAGYASKVLAAYGRLLQSHGLDGRHPRLYWRRPYLTLLVPYPGENTLLAAR